MRSFLWILLFGLGATAAWPAAPFSHHLFDQVLRTHVDSLGRVDYAALKAARTSLDAYLDSLAQYSPDRHPERFPSPDHELAYWINAYNAFVIRGVIDAYPVKSVKDIKAFNGFFRRMRFKAGGEELTLDEIENRIIRPRYQDPRIHFAVNCGATSCPPLENRAFIGANLDTQLDAAQKKFFRAPQHLRLDRENNRLHLSKILDWYGEDFTRWYPRDRGTPPTEPSLVDYLILYLPPDAADFLRQHPDVEISFNHYDWSLNAQP